MTDTQEVLPITWKELAHGSGFSGMIGNYHVAELTYEDLGWSCRIYMFNTSFKWKKIPDINRAKAFTQQKLAEKLWEIIL